MKYPSKYSNGKLISAAQYITELICENKAKKDGKDLHYRFWVNKEWSKYYRDQIATANKLLKNYSEQAVIKAIKSRDAQKIFSLRAPHLIPMIEQEQSIFDSSNKEISVEFDRSENKTFIKNTKNKSVISKLKELE
jgi:hypothetical protein